MEGKGTDTPAVLAVVINERDNVGTMISDGQSGSACRLVGDSSSRESGSTVVLRSEIPFGHKVALRSLSSGELVIKYGEPIGRTVSDVNIGDHIHVHNIEPIRGRGDVAPCRG